MVGWPLPITDLDVFAFLFWIRIYDCTLDQILLNICEACELHVIKGYDGNDHMDSQ